MAVRWWSCSAACERFVPQVVVRAQLLPVLAGPLPEGVRAGDQEVPGLDRQCLAQLAEGGLLA